MILIGKLLDKGICAIKFPYWLPQDLGCRQVASRKIYEEPLRVPCSGTTTTGQTSEGGLFLSESEVVTRFCVATFCPPTRVRASSGGTMPNQYLPRSTCIYEAFKVEYLPTFAVPTELVEPRLRQLWMMNGQMTDEVMRQELHKLFDTKKYCLGYVMLFFMEIFSYTNV